MVTVSVHYSGRYYGHLLVFLPSWQFSDNLHERKSPAGVVSFLKLESSNLIYISEFIKPWGKIMHIAFNISLGVYCRNFE